jgi:hypothetical protein
MWKETEFAWIVAGGQTSVEKFNLSSEVNITGYNLSSFTSAEGASAFSDENNAYAYNSGNGVKFSFATETFTNGSVWGAHGQQKGISSKVGKGYAGNEGSYNGGYNLRRWTTSNDTNIETAASIGSGSVLTNATGVLSPPASRTYLHGGQNSTNYPLMFQVNWWGSFSSGEQSYGGVRD